MGTHERLLELGDPKMANRLAKDTVKTRLKKQLLERENWYKEKEEDDNPSPTKYKRLNNSTRTSSSTTSTTWRRKK